MGNTTITINVVLESAMNDKLDRSARLSGRRKKQEASKRLSDHLTRFGAHWGLPAKHSVVDGGTSVIATLTPTVNDLLNRSKAASGCTKREEAARRLSDHLTRFGPRWEQPIQEPNA